MSALVLAEYGAGVRDFRPIGIWKRYSQGFDAWLQNLAAISSERWLGGAFGARAIRQRRGCRTNMRKASGVRSDSVMDATLKGQK